MSVIGLCFVAFLSATAGDKFKRLQETAIKKYDKHTLSRVQFWINLVLKTRNAETIDKLYAANDFFNVQIQFTSDQQAWQQEDYWATPLESLHKRQGDCEDFSLAKYTSLVLMGVPENQLRLIYVQAQIGPDPKKDVQAHMVTAYYPQPGAEPLILDNLVSQIRPASKRPDLTPVFSFNTDDIWVAGQQNSYSQSQNRLSKWQDALRRMRIEGLFDE